jgi:hypothetical protein
MSIDIEIAGYNYGQAIIVIREVAIEFPKELSDLIRGVEVKGNKVLFKG